MLCGSALMSLLTTYLCQPNCCLQEKRYLQSVV